MIKVPITDVRKGDAIRFEENAGGPYTVDTVLPHEDNAELRVAMFTNTTNMTLPRSIEVYLVSAYRLTSIPCLVCHESYRLLVDIAAGTTPRACLCDDCDKRTTAQVMKWKEEEVNGEDDCDHPDGYEHGSCPRCGAFDDGEDDDA